MLNVQEEVNPLGTLSSTDLVPSGASLGNFTGLLTGTQFPTWFLNSILIAGLAATSPRELDESATMDGASHAQVFFRIRVPLVAPILAVTGLTAAPTVLVFQFLQRYIVNGLTMGAVKG